MLGNHNTPLATRCLIEAPKLFRLDSRSPSPARYIKAEFEAQIGEVAFTTDNVTAQSVLNYYNEYTNNFFYTKPPSTLNSSEDEWMSCYWCENHGFWMFEQLENKAVAKRWLGQSFETEIASDSGVPLRVDKILVHVD
jgi:hypothetical protein